MRKAEDSGPKEATTGRGPTSWGGGQRGDVRGIALCLQVVLAAWAWGLRGLFVCRDL